MTLAVDLSNYADVPTPDQLAAWKDAGVGLVIVQALTPPSGYPHAGDGTWCRQQAQACLDAGLAVDGYAWLWFDLDAGDIRRKVALLDGVPVRQWWLDVEDTAAQKYDQPTTELKIAQALDVLDAALCTGGQPAGIYTARWYWPSPLYLANSPVFAARELWDAAYDGQVTTDGFTPYGGWTARRLHQYQGTTTLAGVGNVDLSVLSLEEAAELEPEPARETPDDYPFADWRQSAIAYRGALDALGKQLETVKGQTGDMAAQLGAALQERDAARATLGQIRALVAA